MSGCLVTSIQRFSTHDGPGIRTVVFLKGCPLRCLWCHNPETQRPENELYFIRQLCIGCRGCEAVCHKGAHEFLPDGTHALHRDLCDRCLRCAEECPAKALEPAAKLRTAEEILEIVLRDAAFFGREGGLTLSGGEPLLQPELCEQLLKGVKAHGLSTVIETCGAVDRAAVKRVSALTDCFFWDIKDTDESRHLKNVGVSTGKILENLLFADRLGNRTVLRCIMIRGVNMEPAHYAAVAKLYASLTHCAGVELLPYHAYGGSKREYLEGIDDGRPQWTPAVEDMAQAGATFGKLGVPLL